MRRFADLCEQYDVRKPLPGESTSQAAIDYAQRIADASGITQFDPFLTLREMQFASNPDEKPK